MAEEAAAAEGARLAFFLPDLHGGGAERVVLNLCRAFLAEGMAVDLLLARAAGTLLGEVPAGVRMIDLSPGLRLPTRAGLALDALLGLLRYLRREPPQALLTSLTGANLVALLAHRLARSRTRLVLREANTAANLRGPLTRRCVRALYPAAHAVIAVSQGVGDDLVNLFGVAAGRVRVIPNPVDIAAIRRLAAEDPREPWFAPGQPPVILGVGRLAAQKDFATLLQAFAAVRRERPCRLILLGEGPLRADLEALAATLGVRADVALPGFVANPYAYMRRAAVFVLSSRWEGMPNALIQALASGVPLVATDCHSGPREVLDEGRYGWLVPVGDAAALGTAIVRAISGENPAGTTARLERAQVFSLESIAPLYLDALLP